MKKYEETDFFSMVESAWSPNAWFGQLMTISMTTVFTGLYLKGFCIGNS
jgi:hypothetical protein